MDIDLSQFYEVFFEEAEEHLDTLENALVQAQPAQDEESLNAIFRAAHSIKGSASTFGFTGLATLTHSMEALLDAIRKGEQSLTSLSVDRLLEGVDLLRKILLAAREGQTHAYPDEISAMQVSLRDCLEKKTPPRHETFAATTTAKPLAVDCFSLEIKTGSGLDWSDLFVVLSDYEQVELDPSADLDSGILKVFFHGKELEFQEFVAELKHQLGSGTLTSLSTTSFTFDLCPAVPIAAGSVDDHDDWGLFGDDVSVSVTPISVPAEKNRTESSSDDFGFFDAPPKTSPPLVAVVPVIKEEGLGTSSGAQLTASVALRPPPSEPVTDAPVRHSEYSTIRINVEKVDELLNLVGELVITKSMLVQHVSEEDMVSDPVLALGIEQLERNTRALQEAVMSVRMVPVSTIFQRFPRVVRDLAQKLGKKVELQLVGEQTEIDKGFIEKLADPLTHLVRNSLDHGIEPPEERAAKGKNPVGCVTLRAFQQGGHIVIEISDDGAGLNRDKIIAKARANGISISDKPSDSEVWNLIFAAGFSTMSQVTDVSGRGVGMDVVRRNIQALGGVVDIQSETGVGTTMMLRLPLTLAILDGMLVRVGRENYILPVNVISESLQTEPSVFHRVENRYALMAVREDYLPIVDLNALLGIPRTEENSAIAIVVEIDKERSVFLVDELLGQHQVVIKNLENNFYRVEGISGATIMGNGHVTLILDARTLVRMSRNRELL